VYLEQMAASLPAREAPARGRRTPRASGDQRERAILSTAERLLVDRPLSEISVEDLAGGAGISRPTFYFYFPSKDAVLLTLVDRMVEESADSREEALAKLAEEPREGLRQGLQASFDAFGSRRDVSLAAAELRATNAEARELWSQVMEGWVADVSAIIESERARGAAPPGQPARELATALVQMNERVQYATFAGETPSLEEDRVMDVLVDVWVRAIYGVPAAD
jgi:AcrR family transcriptional regulator